MIGIPNPPLSEYERVETVSDGGSDGAECPRSWFTIRESSPAAGRPQVHSPHPRPRGRDTPRAAVSVIEAGRPRTSSGSRGPEKKKRGGAPIDLGRHVPSPPGSYSYGRDPRALGG